MLCIFVVDKVLKAFNEIRVKIVISNKHFCS